MKTRIPAAVIGLLLATTLSAPVRSDTPRVYEIELVIFQNLVANDGGEIWPADASLWFEEDMTAQRAPAASPEVTWLSGPNLRLTAKRNALGRSSGYRPLAYLAWRQAVTDRDTALPLNIPVRKSATGAYVDGTVRVAVERYLHLDLDLKLHLANTASTSPAMDDTTPEIRLTESRRMRSKELHYFDNPRFGVVALITPYKPQIPVETP